MIGVVILKHHRCCRVCVVLVDLEMKLEGVVLLVAEMKLEKTLFYYFLLNLACGAQLIVPAVESVISLTRGRRDQARWGGLLYVLR